MMDESEWELEQRDHQQFLRNNPEFYIQNRDAGFMGNAIMFWRKGDSGYTANLNDAKIFSKEESQAQVAADPDKWIAWHTEYIDSNKGIQRIVDSQYLDKSASGIKQGETNG